MLISSVVTLRTQTDSDADLLYRIASDLDTWEERGPLRPAPLTRAVFQQRLDSADPNAGASFMVCADERAVGRINLFDEDPLARTAEVGMALLPDARGKGKGQVIERKAKELEKQALFRVLSGASPLDKEFIVLKEEKGKEATTLTLKPKAPWNDLEQLILRVGPKYLISELILETQSGNKTKITLQNQSLGAKLPAQIFEFKAPAGTEIVNN